MTQRSETWRDKWGSFWSAIKEVLYGMVFHDAVRYYMRQRGSMEHLFLLITFGDIVGLPILPPYYNLRLLPYIVPSIQGWRRSLLREKDLTDLVG
ncbi:MAG: hypothetical protein ACE5NP_05215 [Anaerolineae bacterium]